jgi:hypothetical protein
MGLLTAADRARLLAEKKRKEAQLELANTTYEELLKQSVEEYKLDTSEGSQRVVRRKLSAMQNEIDWLEASINLICRKLNRGAIVNMSLRRIQR